MAAVRPQRARAREVKPFRAGGVRYYQDAEGDWRWRVKAANGRIIANGTEGYTRRADVLRAYATARALICADAGEEQLP
jgi:uncharacterized protein YegP (UPF0339 family)